MATSSESSDDDLDKFASIANIVDSGNVVVLDMQISGRVFCLSCFCIVKQTIII